MTSLPVDSIGAFVGPPAMLAEGAAEGPLTGSTLAVKDLFDVAGVVTGAGNPTFAAGRPPAETTAAAVARLVASGASVIGKTITDELAYSLSGSNVHYGTPINVNAAGRVPGGSSAGSAAAVAAGLCDLALGTDTGGSIRVPASYCGIVGWRPTHGAVPLDDVVALAPSFDTAGLFARDAALLRRAAAVLLGVDPSARRSTTAVGPRLVLAAELLAEVPEEVAAEITRAAVAIGASSTPESIGIDLNDASQSFRVLQGREAWAVHGAWITAVDPPMGVGIRARFAAASKVRDEDVAPAAAVRAQVTAAVVAATAGNTILVAPTTPGPAPRTLASLAALDAGAAPDPGVHDTQRAATLRLTCVAGLAGVPVVVVPLGLVDGLPLGVALVGAPGRDLALLSFAEEILQR